MDFLYEIYIKCRKQWGL